VLAFKKAVELNPNFASALTNLGEHQLQNKQYADAQQTFNRLVQEYPDSPYNTEAKRELDGLKNKS